MAPCQGHKEDLGKRAFTAVFRVKASPSLEADGGPWVSLTEVAP